MEFLLRYLMKVEKCCCCCKCDLKRGTLTILWIRSILLSILIFCLMFAFAAVSDDSDAAKYQARYDSKYDYSSRTVSLHHGLNTYKDCDYIIAERDAARDEAMRDAAIRDAARNQYSFVFSKICIVSVLLYVSLFELLPLVGALYSIQRKNPLYLEPYIFFKVVELLFFGAVLIMMFSACLILTANQRNLKNAGVFFDWSAFICSAFGIVIYACMTYFCLSVVYSYHLKMKQQVSSVVVGNQPLMNNLYPPPEVNQPSSAPFLNMPSAPEAHQPLVFQTNYKP